MEGTAEPGLNRVVWDLREDDPFPDLPEGGRFRPTGLEVLPGSYGVRVRAGPAEVSGSVEVMPDPRVEIPLQVRMDRRLVVQEGVGIMATLLDLQTRLEEARAGIEGLKDLLGGRRDAEASALRSLADSVLSEGEVVGEALSEMSRDSRQIFSLGSVRDAPTESDRIALAQTGEALGRLISRFNSYLVGPVAELREAAEAAGLGPLSDLRPVIRREAPGGGPPTSGSW
jgi:hypothetical protein